MTFYDLMDPIYDPTPTEVDAAREHRDTITTTEEACYAWDLSFGGEGGGE